MHSYSSSKNTEAFKKRKTQKDDNFSPDSKRVKVNEVSSAISKEQIQKYICFRNLMFKEEYQNIFKNVKMLYVFGEDGIIVTSKDDVYAVADSLVDELTKIQELCKIKVKDFVSGSNENCFALTEDGAVYSWGSSNVWGQLGHGNKEMCERPQKVCGSLEGEHVVQLAVSASHCLAVTKEGNVFVWGNNDKNQLGPIGVMTSVVAPTMIRQDEFEDLKITSVAACSKGSAAVSESGEFFHWGCTSSQPLKCEHVKVKKVTATKDWFYAISSGGSLYTTEDGKLSSMFDTLKAVDFASDPKVEMLTVEFYDEICAYGKFGGGYKSNPVTCFTSFDDAFAVLCQLTLRPLKSSADTDTEDECRKSSLADNLRKLWESDGDTSSVKKDVTFSVDGVLLSAHKTILVIHSEYFSTMFNGKWNESREEPISIGGVKHDIFKALLGYFYTDEIEFPDDQYMKIFDLMKLADSYLETDLRKKCESKLMRTLDIHNVFYLLRNAASANAKDLEQRAVSFIVAHRKDVAGISSSKELGEMLGEDILKLIMGFCEL